MSETEARQYLENILWPDGPRCQHCGSEKCGKLNGVKDSKDRVRDGLHKCYACRKQFTVTTNTVMHRSHLSLRQWVLAFYMVCSGKKGIAANEIHRVLGVKSLACAWHMVHRIREAMRETPLAEVLAAKGLLTGIVEADETYIGGKTRGKGRGGRSLGTNKKPVLAIAERGGDVYAKPIDRASKQNLLGTLKRVVLPDARIHTDDWKGYIGTGPHFASHETVCHKSYEYSRGDVHVNTCESYFALLKRGIHGTFHHVSKKHLLRYCDEFSFRWNHRKSTDGERAIAAMRRIGGKRLTYRNLTRGDV
jgi:transposase-like protein